MGGPDRRRRPPRAAGVRLRLREPARLRHLDPGPLDHDVGGRRRRRRARRASGSTGSPCSACRSAGRTPPPWPPGTRTGSPRWPWSPRPARPAPRWAGRGRGRAGPPRVRGVGRHRRTPPTPTTPPWPRAGSARCPPADAELLGAALSPAEVAASAARRWPATTATCATPPCSSATGASASRTYRAPPTSGTAPTTSATRPRPAHWWADRIPGAQLTRHAHHPPGHAAGELAGDPDAAGTWADPPSPPKTRLLTDARCRPPSSRPSPPMTWSPARRSRSTCRRPAWAPGSSRG